MSLLFQKFAKKERHLTDFIRIGLICMLISFSGFVLKAITPPAPIANPDTLNIVEDTTSAGIAVLANDNQGACPPWSLSIVTPPNHGFALVSIGDSIYFLPNKDFNGLDSLEYSACTPCGCDTTTLYFNVIPVPDAPKANIDFGCSLGASTIIVQVQNNDSDPDFPADNLTTTIISQPLSGIGTAIVLNGDSIQYSANGYTGSDTLLYSICDNFSLCDTGIVIFTNGGMISKPTALDDAYAIFQTLSQIICPLENDQLNGFVGSMNILNWTNHTNQQSPPSLFDNCFWINGPNTLGWDSVYYEVCTMGCQTKCDTGLVVFEVVNSLPHATMDLVCTFESQTIIVDVQANDLMLSAATTSIFSPTVNGISTVLNSDSIQYVPDPGFIGADSLQYKLCEGANCVIAWLFIIIKPAPLFALNDTFCNPYEATQNFLVTANDQNQNNVSTTLSIFQMPQNGTANIVGNTTVQYTSNNGYSGLDSIKYGLCSQLSGACDTAWVIINVGPQLTIGNLNTIYCVADLPVNLTGNPAGGIFSGPGISGNTFSPALAGAGGPFTIQYVFTDANNCTNQTTSMVTVGAIPTASFSGLNASVCLDASPMALIGLPSGGIFSGNGILGNSFDPSIAGVGGPYTITYIYGDPQGCADTTTQQITVNALAVVSYSGLNAAYCEDEAQANLAGVPAGGIFSGPGTSLTTFNPSLAGAGGPYEIIYTVTTGVTCPNSDTQYVSVNALPTPAFTGLNSFYCLGSPPASLSGLPAGGVFSGTGISGNVFDPTVAGSGGPYAILYTYTNGLGCTGVDTQSVTVSTNIVASFAGLAGPYCEKDPAVALTGNPVGGVFSGPGIVGNTFDPTVATNGGPYEIVYFFSSGAGCSDSDTQSVVVNADPILSFSGLDSAYCTNESAALLAGLPAGGTFTGTGIVANSFDPSAAGAGGPYTISYAYTNGFGCSAIDSQYVLVSNSINGAMGNVDSSFCMNDPAISLTGTPLGGSFSGNGVNGNQFDPALAGAGLHTIIYTPSGPGACVNEDSIEVEVFAVPLLSFTLGDSIFCESQGSVSLTATPIGGTFSGPGIFSSTFFPDSAGVGGPYVLSYIFITAEGCITQDDENVWVEQISTAVMTGLATNYCENASAVQLTGNPTGGTFSGIGISGSTFDPALAGSGGPYMIIYALPGISQCTDADTQWVSVAGTPAVSFTGLDPEYCESDGNVLLNGNPVDGLFSGPGINGIIFDPSQAPKDISTTVNFNYSDSIGCGNFTDQQTIVYSNPTPANAGPDQSLSGTNQTVLSANNPSSGVGLWTIISGSGTIDDPMKYDSPISQLESGTAILVWEISNGTCPVSKDTVYLTSSELFIPEAFSPNGDGFNDEFMIEGLNAYTQKSLSIFNRWGNEVFVEASYGNNWAGKNSSSQPLGDDTYYYILDLGIGGVHKGYLVIKR